LDQFLEMELFVQVAESGSLSKAAQELKLTVSAASRYLVQLEERLGVRLVQRTTRQMFLTEAGHEFLRRCKLILRDLREAEASVQDMVVRPSGLLRVTASLSFCLLHIEPLLPEFTARYPDITVEIIAANRYLDILGNNVDIAIRTRQFEADRAIPIRKLGETRRVLAASPRYLERCGTPQTPADLEAHKLLIYDYAANPLELSFTHGTEKLSVAVKPFILTNDGQIVVKAALDDLGILVQPKYIVHDHLAAGRLVSVLDDWHLPLLTMNIAFQTRSYMPAKVRLFIEALVERFRVNDYTRLWT
jgi:DNA-binding transcriptional LysR family regulator